MKADFKQNNTGTTWDKSLVDFTVQLGNAGNDDNTAYDPNGNILKMKQWGLKFTGSTRIDNLQYTYWNGGNMLRAVKSRFKLSPKRIASNKLTYRLTKLTSESVFFDKARFVREVVEHLRDEYGIEAEVTHTSVALQRLAQSGLLKYVKVGRQNHYIKVKKQPV